MCQFSGPRSSTGVFSEAPRAFVEEGTPVEFSRATSLSSLTIDDDLPIVDDGVPRVRMQLFTSDSACDGWINIEGVYRFYIIEFFPLFIL